MPTDRALAEDKSQPLRALARASRAPARALRNASFIILLLVFSCCLDIALRQGHFVIHGVNDEVYRQRSCRQELVDAYNPPIIPLEFVEKKSVKSEESEDELDEQRWKWGWMRKRKAHRDLLACFGQILYISKTYAIKKKNSSLLFQNLIVLIFKKNVKKIFSRSASKRR